MVEMVFESRGILKEWKKILIIPILKQKDASTPRYFRPISLCTTVYKMCTRILIDHLNLIIPHLTSPEQSAFISGWNIIDYVLLVQEFMHNLQHAPIRRSLMMIQSDMERIYDQISWQFLR